jgi:arginine:pyruvate transaminase
VLLNTPGNPFGNIIAKEALTRLSAELLARSVWMICDEVYSLFTFDEPHVSLLKCAASLDNIIVVDGLSKSHAMTGWRIGWVASPPEMTLALTAYCGSAFFGCSQFIQDAAAYALRNNGPHVDRMCEAYRERRDFVLSRLDGLERISYIRPKAGMFIMMDVSAICNDGAVFASDLLASQMLSVIPGKGFGEAAAPYVRLSLTHTLDVLDQAMQRIEAFVSGTA